MQKVSSVFTKIEQHELNAILTNVGELIQYLTPEECEKTITLLIPVLQKALQARDATNVVHELEGKSGPELVKAIMERRNKVPQTVPQTVSLKVTQKVAKQKEEVYDPCEEDNVTLKPKKIKPAGNKPTENKKRPREDVALLEDDSDSGQKTWAPYDSDKAPFILGVDDFGYQHGEAGLFIKARARWSGVTFLWFANAASLKFIDSPSLVTRKRIDITSALKRDILQIDHTPDLCSFLGDFKWGQDLLQSF